MVSLFCLNTKFHIYGGTKVVKNLITNGSENLGKPHKYWVFFPRKWECSFISKLFLTRIILFPTQVGVFLELFHAGNSYSAFSHASGSVPVS